MIKKLFLFFLVLTQLSLLAQKKQENKSFSKNDKPNILFICTDDVGRLNVGVCNHGMMVPTPNIDCIGKEGIFFTDQYSAPICTPGRAMMILGQLDPKRMETVDEEFTARTIDFMERSVKEGKPFFARYNPTRMHIYTHLREEQKNLAADILQNLIYLAVG